MLLPLLALTLAHHVGQSSVTVELSRGASLYGCPGIPNYQDVEDTWIEQAAPDALHGGDFTLIGGPGHTILIRFGSLGSVLGPNVKVADAKLVLTMTSADHPTLHSIGAVGKPWGEGPFKTFVLPPKPGEVAAKVNPNTFGATWRAREFGVGDGNWQAPGAQSPSDASPISDVHPEAHDFEYQINGLGSAVQSMLADPGSNNGFALNFDSGTEFVSSESNAGKPRLVVTLQPVSPVSGADLEIDQIAQTGPEGWTASVTNIGSEPATNAKGEWSLDAQGPTQATLPASIAPHQTVRVTFGDTPRSNAADRRFGAITLRITSSANDHDLADKQLTVYTDGIPIMVLDGSPIGSTSNVKRSPLKEPDQLVSSRGKGLTNWIQSQFDLINDVYLARSRFSFAPSGCVQRVRFVQPIQGSFVGRVGGTVWISPDSDGNLPPVDIHFIKDVLTQIGAPDWSKTDFPLGSKKVTTVGWNSGGIGPFPDVTGGGDTRYEGALPSQVLLPEVAATITDAVLEPSGLLSATSVAVLNTLAEARDAKRDSALLKFPTTVFVDASDATGRPLKSADLTFYQAAHGLIGDQPAFTVKTSDDGAALVPNRAIPGTSYTNVFASRDVLGDGVFLVKAEANGEQAWAWLHAWQLSDAAYRGDAAFASVPLQFNLAGGPVDRTINRALSRAITDSAGSFPAKLAALVNGEAAAPVQLPQKPGDWIELDLNRDWTLAELRLTAIGAPWDSFQIQVYQTGQKATNAVDWVGEPDWKWAAMNHGVPTTNGAVSVAYHGAAVQIRYIRIRCIKPGSGQLLSIEAFSTKAGA